MFRKYDELGNLLFERYIQGHELDQVIRSLPTTWPRRRGKSESTLPLIHPTIRTAAVDPNGNLWIGLAVPYTYCIQSCG